MKITCQIQRKNGLPCVPEEYEVDSFYCVDGSCIVYLKDGGFINLTDAGVHHSNTLDSYAVGDYKLGIFIHGIESCPNLHGAGVAQELWIRVQE